MLSVLIHRDAPIDHDMEVSDATASLEDQA
jgi:hypothetical protein